MNQTTRSRRCSICGRATIRHVRIAPHELDEPHGYTICLRSECAPLGTDLANFLQQYPYDDLTFDALLHEVDGHERAKAKYDDSQWSVGDSVKATTSTRTKIGDYSEASQ